MARDEIERLIDRLPKLASSGKAITVDEAEALISDDDDLFDAVALYTSQNVDVFHDWPDQLQKLIATLKRIKPFTPYFKTFYRGQTINCSPNPLGFRSWSANRSTALDFIRGDRDGVVCVRTGRVKGVSISGICMWRMRLRPESHYCGMQAEWLLLEEEKRVR